MSEQKSGRMYTIIAAGHNIPAPSMSDCWEWSPESVYLWQPDRMISRYVLEQLGDRKPLSIYVMHHLLQHQELIPAEWMGKWVFFLGTICRSLDREGDYVFGMKLNEDGSIGYISGRLDYDMVSKVRHFAMRK